MSQEDPSLRIRRKSVGTMKKERSHDENKERAYIAASRRSDRSLDARLQSAKMASEIHKKRTGKGFRITEQIVRNEEMYEEEEEDFPRSYLRLGPMLQTGSTEMNRRVGDYCATRLAISRLMHDNHQDWRGNMINKQFDEAFPMALRERQHSVSSCANNTQQQQQQQQQQPSRQTPQQQSSPSNPVAESPATSCLFPTASTPATTTDDSCFTTQSAFDFDKLGALAFDFTSPPALTDCGSDAGQSRKTSAFPDMLSGPSATDMIDPSLGWANSTIFTPELPTELKQMLPGLDGYSGPGSFFFDSTTDGNLGFDDTRNNDKSRKRKAVDDNDVDDEAEERANRRLPQSRYPEFLDLLGTSNPEVFNNDDCNFEDWLCPQDSGSIP